MTVVDMTNSHVAALMPYEREMFGAEAWSALGYRAELADRRNRRYFAVEDDDGELLGWAGVLVIDDTAEVLTVGVVPSARGRGLARAMLAALYATAVERGATQMLLEVRVDNEPAISLYHSEGFTEINVRRGYYENGRIDAVVMRREL